MATTLRRPPAVLVMRGPPHQPAYNAPIASPRSTNFFTYHTQNPLSVNPVVEQPKLIWNSIAQPITIEGWRRWVRTHMRASTGMMGRVAHPGVQMNQWKDQNRIAGTNTRGFTYAFQQASSMPPQARTVNLTPGGGGGRGASRWNTMDVGKPVRGWMSGGGNQQQAPWGRA